MQLMLLGRHNEKRRLLARTEKDALKRKALYDASIEKVGTAWPDQMEPTTAVKRVLEQSVDDPSAAAGNGSKGTKSVDATVAFGSTLLDHEELGMADGFLVCKPCYVRKSNH